MRVLVVAAHPDDEVFGCGGTIARCVQQGDQVHILFIADGITSRAYHPGRQITRAQELEEAGGELMRRKQEALEAAKSLGLKEETVFFMDFPDQRLDTVPFLDIVKTIEDAAKRIKPQVVYTHWWNDLNLDHSVVCRCVLTAFRPRLQGPSVRVLHFEIPETTYLSVPERGQDFSANVYQDISATLSLKLKALTCYESEKRTAPDLRSPEMIEAVAVLRGKAAGCPAAEAFVELPKPFDPKKEFML